MASLRAIITGWGNFLTGDKEAYQIAVERANVCSVCPFAVKSGELLMFLNKSDKIRNIAALKCVKCGCPLSEKTRSPIDKCPENKWKT